MHRTELLQQKCKPAPPPSLEQGLAGHHPQQRFLLGGKAIIVVAAPDLCLLVSVPPFRSSSTAGMVPQLQQLHVDPGLKSFLSFSLEKASALLSCSLPVPRAWDEAR